jgi:hypothetical protein
MTLDLCAQFAISTINVSTITFCWDVRRAVWHRHVLTTLRGILLPSHPDGITSHPRKPLNPITHHRDNLKAQLQYAIYIYIYIYIS